jgi:hypothetical protein
MLEKPTPIGNPTRDITLNNALFPWYTDTAQPVLAIVTGSDNFHLPCFSSIEKLALFMNQAGIKYDSVKQIEDEREFLSSIPLDILVILDPYYTPKGTVRYTQVLR